MKPSTIAIVGMAGRFPGASNLSGFWQNLRDGVESIRDRSDADLLAAGATPEELASPDYIKRAALLDDVPMFDASFFGFSPRDASIMDPQHRHFLECAWEALEDAGHPPQRFGGSIGVFAGSGMNTYLIHNLLANRRLLETAGLFQLKQTGNDKDVLATRVSYQFDLRGPSINVQTACSTSLVAVHLACQSLLNFECDMALAGGVTIEIPHGLGYIYREGEILSCDGHCRSFDAASSGTVFASGAGIVVLRRLEDALQDHDSIRAVILGSAVNNDGARKVGYLAPSVEGQAEVIAEALDFAGVSAADISYVEAHGTGTIVGDPIEVRALTQAFRKSTPLSGYCGIGSLKSNVGHLDAAAGVAGLIKTVLSLQHAQLPPSLHFNHLNPHIESKSTPFFVNSQLTAWPSHGSPRRAGVTSLGIGGTNAHVVLEEAPRPVLSRQVRPFQLLTVSAKTAEAADQAFTHLAAHLHAHPELSLADVAYTCQLGRQAFPHRRALAVEDTPEAIKALAHTGRKPQASGVAPRTAPPAVFMFSGQGAQYVNMGRELYQHEPVFRETLDFCAHQLQKPLGIDLLQLLYPSEEEKEAAAEKLNQTWLTQPALFSIEYALARWWMSLGVEPAAMVGHSIGEYVAACVAGVLSLEDALECVAFRGRLIYDLPAGSMLAVPLAPAQIPLHGSLSIAAVNSPGMSVVSGPTDEIAALEDRLRRQSVSFRRLLTSHAFHSAMMDPILEPFEKRLRGIRFQPPRIPYLSDVSGTWITAEEATEPAYWARHIRQTVRFSDCLGELLRKPDSILLEAGPGSALTSLARQQGGPSARAFQSLPHPRETVSDLRFALNTLGQLWVAGAEIDWTKLHAPNSAQRVPLPTYPFAHQKFWIEPDKIVPAAAPVQPTAPLVPAAPLIEDAADLTYYRRVWKPDPISPASMSEPVCWIVFSDSLGLSDQIATQLLAGKHKVILVVAGSSYKQLKEDRYTLRPGVREDYDALVANILKSGRSPRKILHLWSVTPEGKEPPLEETLERSFLSPLYLAQALAAQDSAAIDIALVSNHLQQVSDEPVGTPARAVMLGPARVIPKELPGIACCAIDIDLKNGSARECASQLIAEMTSVREQSTVAYRGGQRFVETLDPLSLSTAPARRRLDRGGVYLITGGLGAIGLIVAEHLAREFNARLVLVGLSALPPESEWEAALKDSRQSSANQQKIRKLLEIRSLAGGLLVAQADVASLSQMRDLVALARKQFGKIDGVFHAAGILDDSPLLLKTASATARVLDPKVRGTLVLEEVLRDAPLACFVLFSSISSILPPAGQVDYAAANAFLDAFALSRKGPVTVVNWGAWRDVGMAAHSSSSHPLLEKLLLETPRETVFSTQFSAEKQWVLSEHRLKTGNAVLPGTGYLEMAAAAFARGHFRGAVEFQDVFFLAPMMLGSSASKEVRVQLIREPDAAADKDAFRFSVFGRNGSEITGEWVEHSSGRIAPCVERHDAKVDRQAIAARCRKREIVFDEAHRTRQEHYFDFGPRWRSLQSIHIGEGEGLAELELDENSAADLSTFRMHPAFLDMATGCSLYVTDGYEDSDHLYLPFSYKSIRLYRPLPARLFSHIRSRQQSIPGNDFERFDITLFDEQDQILVEIEGFTMRRIADPTKVSDEGVRHIDGSHSGENQPIQIRERSGISPLHGARALTRILLVASPAAVIAVSQPLEGLNLRTPVAAPAPPANTAAAPNQSVEGTLVSWWQELLGIEKVALEDDFFALGGHSLIGVRLFAKIKKTYQVDLELAALFEARTVRQLSALIRKSRQSVIPEQKGWSYLVPLQPNGSRPPLFFTHAIGGDVLFYERLARALGPSQPFYAFRSTLASQDTIREPIIEEMAAAYIQEMRSLFPQGPYLLGGLSFGGLLAFEMAQQLHAQGVEPGLVILLDASVPGSDTPRDAALQFSKLWQNLRHNGGSYLMQRAALKREYWERKYLRLVRLFACSCYKSAGRRLPAKLRYALMEEMHLRALKRYSFKPYPGKITLIRATDPRLNVLSRYKDPILGWGNLAEGELEILDVPADHMNLLLEPHVQTVAKTLTTLLKRETNASQLQPVA
jgi:acyl transferase domain-containing protein/thioesterase domain-containing protein